MPTKTKKPKKKKVAPVVTQVFAYKHLIGIQSHPKAVGMLNDPTAAGQMGFICDASQVQMSQEALDLLSKIPLSRDCIGDIMAYPAGKKFILGWLGGPYALIGGGATLSRDCKPKELHKFVQIVPNAPSAEFMAYVDKAGSYKGIGGVQCPAQKT